MPARAFQAFQVQAGYIVPFHIQRTNLYFVRCHQLCLTARLTWHRILVAPVPLAEPNQLGEEPPPTRSRIEGTPDPTGFSSPL